MEFRVRGFWLQRHSFIKISSDFLTEYEYRTDLASKLILSEEKKRLIEILIGSTSAIIDDIVSGKSGGVIVLASGPAGVGKTLSAEVFSEAIKRPLYNVQCSQLGIDAGALETNLRSVMGRAARWGAILLMDEADVYIHERGNDMQQNATIGVFLRILEYYPGILFMTTNRATIVDDAIMSRVTAWIKYDMPKANELRQLWKVLSENYGVKMEEADIQRLVTEMPNLSGRNIKNILKLARLYCLRGNHAVTTKVIQYVAKYLDVSEENKTVDDLEF